MGQQSQDEDGFRLRRAFRLWAYTVENFAILTHAETALDHYQLININFSSLELRFCFDFQEKTLLDSMISAARTVDRRDLFFIDLSGCQVMMREVAAGQNRDVKGL